jgi:hypothetical protein
MESSRASKCRSTAHSTRSVTSPVPPSSVAGCNPTRSCSEEGWPAIAAAGAAAADARKAITLLCNRAVDPCSASQQRPGSADEVRGAPIGTEGDEVSAAAQHWKGPCAVNLAHPHLRPRQCRQETRIPGGSAAAAAVDQPPENVYYSVGEHGGIHLSYLRCSRASLCSGVFTLLQGGCFTHNQPAQRLMRPQQAQQRRRLTLPPPAAAPAGGGEVRQVLLRGSKRLNVGLLQTQSGAREQRQDAARGGVGVEFSKAPCGRRLQRDPAQRA